MATIDWEDFLNGWQGQPPTSSTSSSESELLTSGVESAEPIFSKSSFKPSAEPLEEFLVESAGPGLIDSSEFFYCVNRHEDDSTDFPLPPKSDKDSDE